MWDGKGQEMEAKGNGREGKEKAGGKEGKGEERGKRQEDEKGQGNEGRERGEMGREKGKKERIGKGKKRHVPENCRKPQILPNVSILGAPVPAVHPRSGANLASKCGPMVFASMPNFIVIGIYYYMLLLLKSVGTTTTLHY